MSFPNDFASDGSLYILKNNFATTLNGGALAGAASITLTSSSPLPQVGYVTIETEAIKYTANATATGIISGLTRGADSTTAADHADGTIVYGNFVADHHNVLKDEIKLVEANVVQKLGSGTTTIVIPASITAVTINSASLTVNSPVAFNSSTTFAGTLTAQTSTVFNGTLTANTTAVFNGPTTFNTTTTFTTMPSYPFMPFDPTFTSASTGTVTAALAFTSTGFSISLTTHTSTSKIFVLASGAGGNNTAANAAYFSLYRGLTNLMDASLGGAQIYGPTEGIGAHVVLNWIDSPATLGSVTYTVYFRSLTTTANATWGGSKTQTFVAYEIRGA